MIALLAVNTIIGFYMFRSLTEECKSCFKLKDKYVVHGIVLILVPASVLLFITIVFIKLVFFVFVDK